jgi:hypothetical protein
LLRVGAVAVAIVLSTLLSSMPALAASACATAVLRDWSEDGRVAPKYSLPCYEEAIDALPTDIRDYTNAEDVITRALSSAVRTNTAGAPAQPAVGPDADARSAPPVLIALAASALVVLGAGSLGYVARRRRAADGDS